MDKEEKRIKHLEFIEGVINRMASNSFQMKNWMVVCVAALITANSAQPSIPILLALLPVIVFCYYDVRYLQEEKMYRDLYEEVSKENNEVELFNMDASKFKSKHSLYSVFKSWSIRPLYVFVISAILIIHWWSTFVDWISKQCCCCCN